MHQMRRDAKEAAKDHLKNLSYRELPETAWNQYYLSAAVELCLEAGFTPRPDLDYSHAYWKDKRGVTLITTRDFHEGAYLLYRLHIAKRDILTIA